MPKEMQLYNFFMLIFTLFLNNPGLKFAQLSSLGHSALLFQVMVQTVKATAVFN